MSWGHLAVGGVCGRPAQLLATCRAVLATTRLLERTAMQYSATLSGGRSLGEVDMSMGAGVWPVLPGRGTCHHGMGSQAWVSKPLEDGATLYHSCTKLGRDATHRSEAEARPFA